MKRLTERFQEKGMEQQEIMHNGHRWGPAFFPGNGYKEYSDLLDHLAAYEDTGLTPEEIPRWVPVGERLPVESEYRDKSTGELVPLLACVKGTEYPFRAMYDGKSWGDGWSRIAVTHWMALPKAPKEENDAEH